MKQELVERRLIENAVKKSLIQIVIDVLNELHLLDTMTELDSLKRGMTNQLFVFTSNGKRYLLRLPGAGTEHIVNRKNEAAVYHALDGYSITEKILYISGENGVKVSEFVEDTHPCNPTDEEEVMRCIDYLKHFHTLKLKVPHVFDVFAEIRFYEKRCGIGIGQYSDCLKTRTNIMNLRNLVDHIPKDRCLCHIDPVYDNFLINEDGLTLIDWEYAAMSDPDMDVAMHCIYADYDKEMADRVIERYFGDALTEQLRMKVYAYMSACGYLWTLWCEIKKMDGVEFPEYEDSQYRIAKQFYEYAMTIYKNEKGKAYGKKGKEA